MLEKMGLYNEEQINYEERIKKRKRREQELVVHIELKKLEDELTVANH